MSCSGVLWLKILTFLQGFQLTLFQIASLRAFVTLWTCPQQLNSNLILSLSLDFFFFWGSVPKPEPLPLSRWYLLSSQLAVPVWLHTEVNQSGCVAPSLHVAPLYNFIYLSDTLRSPPCSASILTFVQPLVRYSTNFTISRKRTQY